VAARGASVSSGAATGLIPRAASPVDVLHAAREMLPRLRARQAECEALGRLPTTTHAEFVAAGFYRVLQPRRFGGLEFDLPTFFDVMAAIARGCPSSGWVLALTAGHAHTLAAVFPAATQAAIFGADGEYRAPLSANGTGTATPVDGGFRVSGAWNYVSGCDTATHFIGVAAEDGTDRRLFVVFDRADFCIERDWDVIGMRGTGSHRLVVEDAFRPFGHVVASPMAAAGSRAAPGRVVHENPMYRCGRIGSVLFGEMAAVAVGIAQGALDIYEHELRSKRLSTPGQPFRCELGEYQRQYGEAWALISMAEAGLRRVGEEYMRFCRQDVFDDLRDKELMLLEQYITRLAADAVDVMFRSAGTSATRASSPLQRYFRDMAMIRTHFAAQYQRGAEDFGRAYLAPSPSPP
jgi:3-hydroxy-9,10-secoandrosta-1,3,5(10)-triene-9,17-dione monooxygenase